MEDRPDAAVSHATDPYFLDMNWLADGPPGSAPAGFLSGSFGTAARPRRLVGAALAASIVALSVAAYAVAERIAIGSLLQATSHQQDLYVGNVESEMRRYEFLPQVVGDDPRLLDLLAAPEDRQRVQRVDDHLQSTARLTGAAAIYVMDLAGMTLAASNWDTPGSFVGMGFAYRPYFQDAARGRPGRFYGVGTVSREPGYYFANAVRDHGRIVGVVAVKLDLDKLDDTWGQARERVAVVDGNGVIFLASDPQWRFRTLRSLSRETLGRLASTRQYWMPGSLEPLGLKDVRDIDEHTAIFAAEPGAAAGPMPRGDRYLVHSSGIRDTDWQLFVMTDLAPAVGTARVAAMVTALALVLVAMLLLYIHQRGRFVRQTVAARSALQRANDELERKVLARTEALSEANALLHTEIVERRRAEETLRATLQDLVQTAKMAVLGKMSTSITHELNQPLAALQTLSDNTVKLLDRSLLDDARANLAMIGRTVARMGLITGQLKKFARRSDVDCVPVQVNAVLSDALFLLDQSLRERHVRLVVETSQAGVWALCNANRLEQVLVNLVSNAADAVEGQADGLVEILLRQEDDAVLVEVHDNGAGLDDAAAAHLFEPFFTSKAQGAGLGLGLAISSDIVRHFGGKLSADRSTRIGGARFVVQLNPVPRHESVE